jgi:peptide chain release factor 1
MIKDNLRHKLEVLEERYQELTQLLSTVEVIQDQTKFVSYSKEYAELATLVQMFNEYRQFEQLLEDSALLLGDPDASVKKMAQEEQRLAQEAMRASVEQLHLALLPKDPNDEHNVFLEIRAGAGGDEAALFAGDLFRMYSRYLERQGWQLEILSISHAEGQGYKEIIARVIGAGVYARLKFESGTHRVQRVPTTEAQGRIHTSTCTVAILPEVDSIDSIVMESKDLRIDTYRASGAGGQHVNRTDSAVRITHIPSGMVVECQEERSQHKNKAKAMQLLQARLNASEQEKQQQQEAATRKSLVGSGQRCERIRTYNYPQGRLTDHRINLTVYKLPEIMEGDLDCVLAPLAREHQLSLLEPDAICE